VFYARSNTAKETKALKVSLTHFKNGINTQTDENLLPLNYASNTYNFSFLSGALREGLGFNTAKFMIFPTSTESTKELTLADDSGIENIWLYRCYSKAVFRNEYILIVYTRSKKLYWAYLFSPLPAFQEIMGVVFSECPQAVNYRLNDEDVIMFSASDNVSNMMYIWDMANIPSPVYNTPMITSMCIHNERLFITSNGDKKTLYFSDDLDPTNWRIGATQAGYITMTDERGGLNKILSFNGYVYALRDYGISRVTAWGAQSDFSVNHLFTASGRIYHNTAVLCGDRILMLCSDGLYVFDGLNASKHVLGIEAMMEGIDNALATAEYHNGKYYLACRMNFGDDRVIGCEDNAQYKNNAVIEYDVKTGEFDIARGVDVCVFRSVQDRQFSKLLVCFNTTHKERLAEVDKSGKVFNIPTLKVWSSPTTDMGYPDKVKVLKELIVTAKHECQFIVKTDKTQRTFSVKASSKPTRVRINMPARVFSFEFVGQLAQAHITNPQLLVTVA